MPRGQELDELFWTLGTRIAPLITGVGVAQKTLKRFAAFMKTPIGAVAALGVAALLAGRRATRMGQEFDLALREVSTLLPTTVDQMGDLKDAIIQLSTEVPEPPAQLTKGLYQVVSAGVTDTAEAMEVLAVASKAGTAGLADSFQAVDAITTVLNAYELEATQATRVSDVFFTTIAEGKIRLSDIASTIGDVATTAALAGVSIEEVGAAMATMTKFGISAAESTTALNRFLLSIITATADQKAEALEMGIALDSASLAADGLSGFLAKMSEVTEGNIDALSALNPNIRAARAAFILAGKGNEEFNRILGETTNSVGATETAFQKIRGDLNVQKDLVKNQLNQAWFGFSDVTLPLAIAGFTTLNRILGVTQPLLQKSLEGLSEFSDEQLATAIEGAQSVLDQLQEQQRGDPSDVGTQQLAARGLLPKDIQETNDLIVQQEARIRTLLATQERRSQLAAEANRLEQGAIAQITSQIERLNESIQPIGEPVLPMDPAEVEKLADRVKRLAEEAEEAAAGLEGLRETLEDNSVTVSNLNRDVESLVDEWRAGGKSVEDNVRVYGLIRARITAVGGSVDDLIPALREAVDFIKRGGKEGGEMAESMGDLADSSIRAARALLDAGRAMGVLGSEAAAALSAVANITESVLALTGEGLTPGGQITAIAGIAAGVLSLGASIFGGQSETERLAEELATERADTTKRNTVALIKLAQGIAGLNESLLGLPLGGTLGSIVAGLGAGGPRTAKPRGAISTEVLRALAELGLSENDLREVASALGIEIDGTRESLENLATAIREVQISTLLDTFAGSMTMLRREFELFDIDDPREQVRRMLGVLDQFTDLDVPDLDKIGAEGVNDFIQSFFTGLQNLTPEEMAARFGGLSVNQILDLLGTIETLLDETDIEAGAEAGVTRGFQVSRTITEVTGNRLVGTMTTVSFWAERTALAAEGQLAILSEFTGITAPSPREFSEMGGPLAVEPTSVTVAVTVNVGDIILPSVTDPNAAAREIAGRLREEVDRAMGERMLDTRRARGLGQPDGLRN